MNSHLGPVEIECDAPPYAVVQACAYLGCSRSHFYATLLSKVRTVRLCKRNLVDFDSLEDDAVTVRDRDSTEQVRVRVEGLLDELRRRTGEG